jgi:hypothetical protein
MKKTKQRTQIKIGDFGFAIQLKGGTENVPMGGTLTYMRLAHMCS